MNEELIPRIGDLVKMKIDLDRGNRAAVGVVHKVRALGSGDYALPPTEVYDITWPDVRSVQYLSEIRVISRS